MKLALSILTLTLTLILTRNLTLTHSIIKPVIDEAMSQPGGSKISPADGQPMVLTPELKLKVSYMYLGSRLAKFR